METDFSRWEDASKTWGSKNPERANVVAQAVNALAVNLTAPKLLDIGCGGMALKNFLSSSISYYPADIIKRSPECQVIEINNDAYPEGSYDIICAIGVI